MKTKATVATLVLSFFVFAIPVLAQTQVASPAGSRPPFKNRLTETRMRSCQAREGAIKNRTDGLFRMTTNMIEKFDAITQRVKDFYINKVIPSGRSVSNYDDLVADIEAKKALVQTELANARTRAGDFNCDGDDPKGLLTQFRADMQGVKGGLKNFRLSIKNLIVAVRGLAPTPVPTATPTPTQ